jgi:hypothetical protein
MTGLSNNLITMAKLVKRGTITKVADIAGIYYRSEESPSLFNNPITGVALIIKDRPRKKTLIYPAAQLLVKAPGENMFYHMSGMWQTVAGRNEYRISDNTKDKPKGIAYVKYDLFQLSILNPLNGFFESLKFCLCFSLNLVTENLQ